MRNLKTLILPAYHKKYGTDPSAALYVVNTSDGRVTFNCKGDVTGSTTVVVPASYAPTDLTALATRDNVVQNPHFRRFLNNGMLVIVDNEDLEKMLQSDSDLREEYNTVNDIKENATQATIQVDLSGEQDAKRKTPVADNEQAVEDPLLASLIQECALLDKDADGSRLKDMEKSLKRKLHTFDLNVLQEFVEACPSQELRDIALNRVNALLEE